MIRRFRILLALVMAVSGVAGASARPPLVLAAASLQEALAAAAAAWTAKGHERPVLSFAASSTLARQIEAGAPADLFVSADKDWMDVLERQGRLRAGTRADLVGNRLVLVAPVASRASMPIGRGFPLARMLGRGRLAIADPGSVPAGRYGKAALTALGIWPQLATRLAPADSVRAALALVERGQAPYGIVYATDAAASKAVRVVGAFPPASHPPIVYPVAALARATSPDTIGFERFLLSTEGRALFRRFGFLPPR